MDDLEWLDEEERGTWVAIAALAHLMPAAIEAQLQRDSGLGFFDYMVLAMLSEQSDQTMQMSELASIVNGSLSRLSHVAKRLESRGLLSRRPDDRDGRITVASLTPEGHDLVRQTAPGHVRHVRRIVFDPLDTVERRALRRACLKLLGAIDPDAQDAVARASGSHGCDSASRPRMDGML